MAALAARAIQSHWSARLETLVKSLDLAGKELGVGVGIRCGELSFGEFGRSHRDLTAVGTVVNIASRAQSAATAGEIPVTEAVCERVPSELAGSRAREFQLKGIEAPTTPYAA